MNHILWIDLEMTGLNSQENVIIEVAAIVTQPTYPFKEVDQFHCVVRQHKEHLDKMDSWNSKIHRASGLYDQIPSGKTEKEAEDGLLHLIETYFKGEPVIIAGNSINQDRIFIKKYFKKVESKLHFRMLDVSSWKLVMEKQNITFEKRNIHRALTDIQESIGELKFYYEFLDQKKLTKKEPLNTEQ